MAKPRRDKTTFDCPHCKHSITLVGTREAAALLETNVSTFHSWKIRPDFPVPLWDAGQGGLWRREDVLEWYQNRQKQQVQADIENLASALAELPRDRQEQIIEGLRRRLGETAA